MVAIASPTQTKEKNMKKLDTRLWNVTGGKNENITVSHIEAKTAAEALTHFFENKKATKVESWPIYEAGLDLEYGEEEANEVIDITIRGTNDKKVQRLVNLLAMAIGGPFGGSLLEGHEGEDYDYDQVWLDLRKEFEKHDAMVTGI